MTEERGADLEAFQVDLNCGPAASHVQALQSGDAAARPCDSGALSLRHALRQGLIHLVARICHVNANLTLRGQVSARQSVRSIQREQASERDVRGLGAMNDRSETSSRRAWRPRETAEMG